MLNYSLLLHIEKQGIIDHDNQKGKATYNPWLNSVVEKWLNLNCRFWLNTIDR